MRPPAPTAPEAEGAAAAVTRPAMPIDEARARLVLADHGVLSTVDPAEGVHAVPVCFAVVGDRLVVPIDTVKAKRVGSAAMMRRTRNVEHDPRAVLLVEHWDRHDWQQLWWVRAQLRHRPTDEIEPAHRDALVAALRDRYPQYRGRDFAGLLVFDVVGLSGWSAERPAPTI